MLNILFYSAADEFPVMYLSIEYILFIKNDLRIKEV